MMFFPPSLIKDLRGVITRVIELNTYFSLLLLINLFYKLKKFFMPLILILML